MTDEAAFITSYMTIRRDVERFAMFISRDRASALDLVQEALISAVPRWPRIGSAEKLKPYLITSIVRMYRRTANRATRTVGLSDLDLLVLDGSTPPDVLTDVTMVRDAIGGLPDALRIPLVLSEIEGYPMQEIAQMLGIGLSAVKMRVKRGRDELRRLFEEHDVEKEAGK